VPWQEPYCSNLSSQRCNRPSPDTTSWSGAIGIRRLGLCRRNPLADGRRAASPLKGTDRVPTARYMSTHRKCGIAYGARALWRRSLRSSPSRGKPGTWRREAGVLDDPDGRCA
jgi:hypothetical protein